MAKSGPIPYYFDILSKWPTAIASESQWFVYIPFKDVGPLKRSLYDTLKRFETGSGNTGTVWSTQQSIADQLTKNAFQEGHDYLGCVFADKITLPSESIKASNQGLNFLGFQAPATMDYRVPQTKLSISFRETNLSIVDFILRPWTMLVGHYGFVTRGNGSTDIKAPYIDVVYLGNSGAFKSGPYKRKIIRFHNAAPINVQGATNSYASNSYQSTSVDFVYDYYSIEGADSNRVSTE